jgi:hypothetical protein
VILSAPTLERIRQNYAGLPPSLSNWSYFATNAITQTGQWSALRSALKRTLRPGQESGKPDPQKLYEKSIYGSTLMLPVVLQACLDSGLSESLGEIPLLIGHDILLEGTKDHSSFGFHDDGFGWDLFFQTGDDLTLYVALQDMNEQTGGRLFVERRPEKNIQYQDRNAYIQRFAHFCREQGAVDARGRVTREAAARCRRRNRIAAEYQKLAKEWKHRVESHSGKVEMSPIELSEGEVILFNNKLFHDVEPWKMDTLRSAYIIRCIPLYDMGLHPPSSFLNDAACNRFLLESGSGPLRPVDVDQEALPLVPCPD